MEKTITIDGRQVTFKSSGALPKRYKAQFGRDYFSDMYDLKSMSEAYERSESDSKPPNFKYFDLFYDIAWTLAKTADNTIPDPMSWLDEFDEFPIAEILPEIQDLIAASISSNNDKKKQQVELNQLAK